MRYTEIVVFTIDRTCYKNAICLRWLNQLGGYETYVFTGEKSYGFKTQDSKYFRPAIDVRNNKLLARDSDNILTVRSGLIDEQTADFLKSLYESIRVAIVNDDGTLIPVTVEEKNFSIRNETDSKYTCEFNIILPKTNNLIS